MTADSTSPSAPPPPVDEPPIEGPPIDEPPPIEGSTHDARTWSPSPRQGLLLGGLSGFLYFLAFPGVDFWPVAFIALTPAMLAIREATPKQAAFRGIAMGMCAGVPGFYWLLDMLSTFSGFPWILCLLFMLILVGFQAGCFALMTWIGAAGARRGWPPGLSFALGFIASETVYPLLFPFTFAATLHQLPAFLQVAEWGGPILVALPLVASAWAAYVLIVARLESRSLPWKKAGALAAVPALSALYGAVRIPQIDRAVAEADKIRVGLVQANMGLMEKRVDRSEGLRRHIELTQKLVKDGAEFVVWSETSVAGAVPEDRAAGFYRTQVARHLGVPALLGAVLSQPVSDARKYRLFNSALLTGESGKVIDRYDKQFLLAFGEFLPFGESFPILYEWSPNSGHFSPGQSYRPLQLGDHEIAVFICYEDIIPSFVNRIMNSGDAELLVNMTNDAWFGDSSEPVEHMALSKLRAVEQRRWFVRSTNSGISGFVDPAGRQTQKTGTFEQAAISEEVAWLTMDTGYRMWGNAPWWLLSFAAFGVAFWAPPKRRRRRGAPTPQFPAERLEQRAIESTPVDTEEPEPTRHDARAEAE